jgi:hypothetical protein
LDLRRIPSAVLVALGLEACADRGVSTCLSMVATTDGSEDGTGTSGSSSSDSGDIESTSESDVGPCLGQVMTTEGTGVDTSGGDSGSSDDSGTSDTDEGSDTSTSACLTPPGDALPDHDDAVAGASPSPSSWQQSFARIADKLPADVAARLGRRNGGDR